MNPKYLLDTHGISPKRSLGQNFLHDPNALEKIVDKADLLPGDTVLEIGPGTGSLTVALAQTRANVIAVEIDDRLLPILHQQLADYPNVRIVHADILEADVDALVGDKPYVVVANLPYYITSAILRNLLERQHKPHRMLITVQQEVAERLIAKPGDLSLLAISVMFYGQPSIVTKFSPATFWPRPDVDSAVVRIDVYDQPPVDVPDEETFFKVVRSGFGQKRKQLKNSLGAGLGIAHADAEALLDQAGLDPTRRAETLTLDEWAALSRAVGVSVAHQR